jgi:hypothetical protein
MATLPIPNPPTHTAVGFPHMPFSHPGDFLEAAPIATRGGSGAANRCLSAFAASRKACNTAGMCNPIGSSSIIAAHTRMISWFAVDRLPCPGTQ